MEEKIAINDRSVEANKIVEDMNKEFNIQKMMEMIKNNIHNFEHKGSNYQVRLLSYKDKYELDMLKRKKFGQLLKDADIMMEKALINNYKEKGIDIDAMEDARKKIEDSIHALQLKLGSALAKKEEDIILKEYESQIDVLTIKLQQLLTQKNLLLEYSLENQLLNFVSEATTFLVLYIEKSGQWERAFESLDSFRECKDETLIVTAGAFAALLQL